MNQALYRGVTGAFLFLLAANMIMANGFMLLRVPPVGPGIPINQIALMAGLMTIAIWGPKTYELEQTLPFMLLYGLWVLSIAQLIASVGEYGPWAIRDAANVIESGFFVIGYCLSGDPRFRTWFFAWLGTLSVVVSLYTILYPIGGELSQFVPWIPSLSGYYAPLLFSYVNISSLAITSVCFLLLWGGGSRLVWLLCGLTLMVLIVFVQARITYLQLAFLMMLLAAFSPRDLLRLSVAGAIAMACIALFLSSGIQLPGRLGQSFTVEFLLSHVQAIWGGGGADTRDAAEGVGLRLNWWLAIHQSMSESARQWFFGLGYGMPLTSFRGTSDDVVREPHNSYVSIYGRLGAIGLLLFLGFLVSVMISTLRLIRESQRSGDRQLFITAVTLACFFGVHLIYHMAEGGMEVSFIAVPFYSLAGVAVQLSRQNRGAQCTRVDLVKVPKDSEVTRTPSEGAGMSKGIGDRSSAGRS